MVLGKPHAGLPAGVAGIAFGVLFTIISATVAFAAQATKESPKPLRESLKLASRVHGATSGTSTTSTSRFQGVRNPSPGMEGPGRGHHPPGRHPPGIGIIAPFLPVPGRGPSYGPSQEPASESDKIRDIPYDQEYEEDAEKPKPKSKPKTQPVPAPVKDLHPEHDGSMQARACINKMAVALHPGLAEFVWKDPHGAEKLYLNALKEAGTVPYPEGRRAAHKNLGDVYYLKGLFTPAIDHYQKALELNTKIGDGENHAVVVSGMAAALWAAGAYDSARGYFDEALSTFHDIGSIDGEANTRNNLGVLFETQGRLDHAVEQFRTAMAVDKTNLKLRVVACVNLAEVLQKQGKYEEAQKAYNESLEASRKIRNVKLQAQALIGLGLLHREWAAVRNMPEKLGESATALLEAFRLSQRSGVPTLYPSKLLGDVYLDQADTVRAEPFLKDAAFNSSLGRMYLMRKDYRKAREHYEKLLDSAKKYQRNEDLMVACIALGMIHEESRNLPKAEECYAKGVDAAETIRNGKLLSERRGFYGTPCEGFFPSEAAKGLTRAKIKRTTGGKGHPDQTIYATELTRAREFSDHLARGADVGGTYLPKDVLEQEKKLMNQIASLSKARDLLTRDQDREAYDKKTKDLNEAETRLRDFVETTGKRNPLYAATRHPNPIDLADAALGSDEFAVVFDAAQESLSVKLIKGKQVVKAACIDWNLADLTRSISEFRNPFDGHEGAVDPNRLETFDVNLAHELYKRLFSDILDAVPEGSPLVIIPDQALGNLPFEALVVRGQVSWKKESGVSYPEGITYLGELHPISYCQSITALTLSRAFPRSGMPGDRFLVVVDPVFGKADERFEQSPPAHAADHGRPEPGRFAAVSQENTASEHDEARATQVGTLDESERTMAPVKALRRKAKVETDPAARRPTSVDSRQQATPPGTQEFGRNGQELTWPRLKLTAQLGDALYQMFGDQVDLYRGMQATKSVVLSKPLNRYRSLVFGTHGYFGQDIPGVMEPVLVLSPGSQQNDPYLRMGEVAGLDLNADLVVLAACQTGLGNYQAGEGIISMGRAFQYAGARSVLMSLWTVPEAASMALVDRFLTHIRQGEKKAVALSMARDEIREERKHYAHPFYWAPFILVGESWPVPERIRHEAADRFMNALTKKKKVQPPPQPKKPRQDEDEE